MDPTTDPIIDPTLDPITNPTANPTLSPVATSHGDPIIWTFNGECYDLNKDGLYVATKSTRFSHTAYIGVYNDFMREFQLIRDDGLVLLYINNLGEYDRQNYPWKSFSMKERDCKLNGLEEDECVGSFTEFSFDVQEFFYTIHILRHNYKDPALKEGELGYHLDVYLQPYSVYEKNKHTYSGLYFENPLPEELKYCPVNSERRTDRD